MRKHGTSIVVILYVAAILSGCFGNIRQNEDISKEGESKSESYPELAAVLTEFTSDMTWGRHLPLWTTALAGLFTLRTIFQCHQSRSKIMAGGCY